LNLPGKWRISKDTDAMPECNSRQGYRSRDVSPATA
jgi:hypothetical protein